MEKSKLIFVLLLLSYFGTIAQSNRYVVYFKDKTNTQYSIDKPLEYLSQRSIDRRSKQDIAITIQDFPVNQNYIDSLVKYGVKPYFQSKWMNAVLVETTKAKVVALTSHIYIDHIEYVAPGTRLGGVRSKKADFPANQVPKNNSGLSSDAQNQMMEVARMHTAGFNGKNVWIAVFDGGFAGANKSSAFSHIAANNRLQDVLDFITGGADVFKYNGHGTSTWSCMAAKLEDTYSGVAHGAYYSLYVTEDVSSEYRIEEYNWLFAAERADSVGVDIINTSLGYVTFDDSSMDYTYDQTDGKTALISTASDLASAKGMLLVTSAGNSGLSTTWPYISMPGDAIAGLTVGAVDSQAQKSDFSSIGPTTDGRLKPEVVALGTGVVVVSDLHELKQSNGTSFSAPLVAGFAAGLWQQFPSISAKDLKTKIISSCTSDLAPNNNTGHGIPNYKVIENNSPLTSALPHKNDVLVYPNPTFSDYLQVKFDKNRSKKYIVLKLYSPTGQLVNEMHEQTMSEKAIIEIGFNHAATGIYLLYIQMDDVIEKVKILRLSNK